MKEPHWMGSHKASLEDGYKIINRWGKDIKKGLAQLSERNAKMVAMRYGLIDGITHTFKEVGKQFGVSHYRALQIIRNSLHILWHKIPQKKQRLMKIKRFFKLFKIKIWFRFFNYWKSKNLLPYEIKLFILFHVFWSRGHHMHFNYEIHICILNFDLVIYYRLEGKWELSGKF